MQRALNQRPSLRKKQGLKIWMGELSSQVDSILSIPGYAAAAPGATPLALPDLIFFADPLHFFHVWVMSSVKLKCLFAQRVQQQCQHLNQMKKWWRN